MPYIDRESRARIDAGGAFATAGGLAYAVAREIERYRQERGDSFQSYAEIDGAVMSALNEFRRKIVHKYEDGKAVSNGSVFD